MRIWSFDALELQVDAPVVLYSFDVQCDIGQVLDWSDGLEQKIKGREPITVDLKYSRHLFLSLGIGKAQL